MKSVIAFQKFEIDLTDLTFLALNTSTDFLK